MSSSDVELAGEEEARLVSEARPAGRWARPAALAAALGLVAVCGLGAAALRAPAEPASPWEPEDVEMLMAWGKAPAGAKAWGKAPAGAKAMMGKAPAGAKPEMLQLMIGKRAFGLATMALSFHGGSTRLSKGCLDALDEYAAAAFAQMLGDAGGALDECDGEEGDSAEATAGCKEAAERLRSLKSDFNSSCRRRGELCTASAFGHELEQCVPKACRDELGTLALRMEERGWMKRKGVKVSLSCPAGGPA